MDFLVFVAFHLLVKGMLSFSFIFSPFSVDVLTKKEHIKCRFMRPFVQMKATCFWWLDKGNNEYFFLYQLLFYFTKLSYHRKGNSNPKRLLSVDSNCLSCRNPVTCITRQKMADQVPLVHLTSSWSQFEEGLFTHCCCSIHISFVNWVFFYNL